MRLLQLMKQKLFLATFVVFLAVLLGSSFFFKQHSSTYYDPIPQAVDDDETINSTKYGILLPVFTKEEVSCFCAPTKPAYRPGIGVPIYTAFAGILALGTTFKLKRNQTVK